MLVPNKIMDNVCGFANPSKKRKINPQWINTNNNNNNNSTNNNNTALSSLYTSTLHNQQQQQAQHPPALNHSQTPYHSQQQQHCHLPQKIAKTEDVLINLKVDLLQLYKPQPQTLSVVRNRLCGKCNGAGLSSATDTENDTNNNLTNKCDVCFGRGVYPNEKQFTFSIQGRSHGDEIRFKGEADEKIGFIAGDIVVILNQIPDPTFQRDGPHLYIKKEIVLVEALCGGEFFIKHLDGRIIKFNTRPSEVLSPYQIKCIPNQGMPYHDNIHRRGHIFVQFEVKFPEQPCNPHLIQVLQRFLPKAPVDPLSTASKQHPNRVIECELVELAFPKTNQLNDYDYSADTLKSNNNTTNNDDSDMDVKIT